MIDKQEINRSLKRGMLRAYTSHLSEINDTVVKILENRKNFPHVLNLNYALLILFEEMKSQAVTLDCDNPSEFLQQLEEYCDEQILLDIVANTIVDLHENHDFDELYCRNTTYPYFSIDFEAILQTTVLTEYRFHFKHENINGVITYIYVEVDEPIKLEQLVDVIVYEIQRDCDCDKETILTNLQVCLLDHKAVVFDIEEYRDVNLFKPSSELIKKYVDKLNHNVA